MSLSVYTCAFYLFIYLITVLTHPYYCRHVARDGELHWRGYQEITNSWHGQKANIRCSNLPAKVPKPSDPDLGQWCRGLDAAPAELPYLTMEVMCRSQNDKLGWRGLHVVQLSFEGRGGHKHYRQLKLQTPCHRVWLKQEHCRQSTLQTPCQELDSNKNTARQSTLQIPWCRGWL